MRFFWTTRSMTRNILQILAKLPKLAQYTVLTFDRRFWWDYKIGKFQLRNDVDYPTKVVQYFKDRIICFTRVLIYNCEYKKRRLEYTQVCIKLVEDILILSNKENKYNRTLIRNTKLIKIPIYPHNEHHRTIVRFSDIYLNFVKIKHIEY